MVGGPTVHICLQVHVAIPTMTLSCERVEFATIQCGQCLVETIQLYNQLQVPCEWFVVIHKPFNKVSELRPIDPLFSSPLQPDVLEVHSCHFTLLLRL